MFVFSFGRMILYAGNCTIFVHLPTHNKRTFFITFPFTKVEQCEPLGHENGSLKLQNAQHDDSDRYQKRKKSKFIQSLNQQPGRVVSTASYSQPY